MNSPLRKEEHGLFPLSLVALAAAAVPTLLAYNTSPSPTFFNQAAALMGWGVFAIAAAPRIAAVSLRGISLVLAPWVVMVLAAACSSAFGSLPASLSLSAIGLLLASAVMCLSGGAIDQALRSRVFVAFCWGWIGAAALSAAVAFIQVFAPEWADGDVIARSGLIGRAVGNLRQPNHLSSVLVWGMAALVVAAELTPLPRWLSTVLMVLFVVADMLSASRTGMVAVVILALWGVIDGRLSRFARALLIAAPIVYLIAAAGMAIWAHVGHHVFAVETRLGEADMSSSRFRIWANTLSLIRQEPWLGVGYGEFNIAWTMTPFPQRPPSFFDHTHNLVLQLAVELGIPVTLLMTALIVLALHRAWQGRTGGDADDGVARRGAIVMVLLMLLHSLLEYPLWYGYFLLPIAWVLGFAATPVRRVAATFGGAPLRFATGMLAAMIVAGGALSLIDYGRVTAIFSPPDDAAPLQRRIADGQASVLFSHHADYAAATTADHPGEAMAAFDGAIHYLLDTRLMIAWSKAYAERGDLDRARYVAQRLREFHKPEAEEFFAPCADPAKAKLAFQCQEPQRALTWRDFTRP